MIVLKMLNLAMKVRIPITYLPRIKLLDVPWGICSGT
jgi:hypothetical protein